MTDEELIQQSWSQINRVTEWASIILKVPGERGQTGKIPICKNGPKGQIVADSPDAGKLIVFARANEVIRYLISCPKKDAIGEIIEGAQKLQARGCSLNANK